MLIRSKPLTQRPMALDGPPSISICYASAASLPIEDLFKLLEVCRTTPAIPQVFDRPSQNPTLLHMPSICFREYKQSLIALSTNSSLIGLRRSVQLLKNLLGQREFDSLEFVDIALEVCRWWKQNISQGRKTSSNGIANNPPPALSQAAYSLPTGDYNDPKDEDGRESIAHIGKMICAISKLKIEDGFRYLYAPRYVLGAYIINVTTAFDDPGSRYFRQEAADVLLPRAAPEDPHETEDPGETEDSDSQSCWSEETDQPGEHWKLIPEWDFEDILRPTHTLSVYQLYYLP